MTNSIEIVFVDIKVYQPYIIDAIKNLQLLGNRNITVITDPHLVNNFTRLKDVKVIGTNEFDLQYFDELTQLDDSFRQGFWKNTSKRLFYLYHYMKEYNRKNCVHLENDVMVYENLQKLFSYSDKLWLVLQSPRVVIPDPFPASFTFQNMGF